MSPLVFAAVLFAALLHASWNAMIKGGLDKRVSMGALVMGHVPLALVALPFVPAPAPESWPYIAAGVALHMGYQIFLIQSYRLGDLTQVYPIARGSAPLLVALISVTALGVTLAAGELIAILLIAIGILSLALTRRADGGTNPRAALVALGTGVFIAGYSLVDGLGARAAGTALGYYGWLTLFNGACMALWLRAFAPGALTAIPRDGRTTMIVGGGASFLAYAIVTWAFTQAPIALVTALRETSIVFALLIGVVFLRERVNLAKVASTALTLTGAILLRFAAK